MPYDGWVWPVELHATDGRKPVITDGWSAVATHDHRQHLGVDIMYRRRTSGTPALPGMTEHFECIGARAIACGPGTVWRVSRTDPHGIVVEIDHHHVPGVGPRVSVYRHLESSAVAKGDPVRPGQYIGAVGYDTAKAPSKTPNHLHFELWDTSRPRRSTSPRCDYGIDPEPAMRTWGYRGRDGKELVA